MSIGVIKTSLIFSCLLYTYLYLKEMNSFSSVCQSNSLQQYIKPKFFFQAVRTGLQVSTVKGFEVRVSFWSRYHRLLSGKYMAVVVLKRTLESSAWY